MHLKKKKRERKDYFINKNYQATIFKNITHFKYLNSQKLDFKMLHFHNNSQLLFQLTTSTALTTVNVVNYSALLKNISEFNSHISVASLLIVSVALIFFRSLI